MTNLENVLIYIYGKYPHPSELSKARLVKLVYLSDWKHCIDYGRQITTINWYFNHYGPFVTEIIEAVEKSEYFSIVGTTNYYNQPKELVTLVKEKSSIHLEQDVMHTLDYIIETTSKMFWEQFIQLVYSTYPIMVSEKHTFMDLPVLAKEYQQLSVPA